MRKIQLRLEFVPVVNDDQAAFGNRIGVDFSGCSVNVASAMIEDVVQAEFQGDRELGGPTDKQVLLARKFGYDISSCSKRVASAVIDDIMLHLNNKSISSQGLCSNVLVRHKFDGWVKRISSIKEDGTVYLKGGNGVRAWARSLERVVDPVDS